ncbi:MAG: DUF4444 domain-containing protein [Paracoccaceae bacterium]|nr:DUF4444 domain-containing protein [Paracoccaceae bacterium]
MTTATIFVETPAFPPLLTGVPLAPRLDPFEKAVAVAMTEEIDAGTVYYAEDDGAFRTAIVLVPETPLSEAAGALFAVSLGLADALGALAPPEVAVQFDWPATVKVNGAAAGALRMAASTDEPGAVPDWLVIGAELAVTPLPGDPGARPGRTALHEEGCIDITTPALIESWSRHMLVWIHRFVEDGLGPLHAEWRGKCDRIGEEVTEPAPGTFVGLDENGGMLLRSGPETRVIPLTTLLGGG